MSDIKFSEFNNINAPTPTLKIVGHDNIQNIKISPVDLFPNTKGFINNLIVENDTTTLTVKAGLIIDIAGTLLNFSVDSIITPSNVSGFGYKWRCLCIAENASIITYKNLSDFTNIVGLSESINQLGLNSLYNNTYGYCRGLISGVYYRIFYIFKQFSTFTDSTVDTLSTKILDCNDSSKFSIGQKVTGTDIPANSEIIEIINATSFRINQDCTGSTSNITMTVANGIIECFQIEKEPKSLIKMCDYNNQIDAGGEEIIEAHVIELDVNSEIAYTDFDTYTIILKKNSNYKSRFCCPSSYAGGGQSPLFTIWSNNFNIADNYSSGYSYIPIDFYIEKFHQKNDQIKFTVNGRGNTWDSHGHSQPTLKSTLISIREL